MSIANLVLCLPGISAKISEELGVGYVVEGSVRKEGDRVRIVAQLVNTNTGDHAWADRFDKAGTDPWALQDELTGKIVGAMTGRSHSQG